MDRICVRILHAHYAVGNRIDTVYRFLEHCSLANPNCSGGAHARSSHPRGQGGPSMRSRHGTGATTNRQSSLGRDATKKRRWDVADNDNDELGLRGKGG